MYVALHMIFGYFDIAHGSSIFKVLDSILCSFCHPLCVFLMLSLSRCEGYSHWDVLMSTLMHGDPAKMQLAYGALLRTPKYSRP